MGRLRVRQRNVAVRLLAGVFLLACMEAVAAELTVHVQFAPGDLSVEKGRNGTRIRLADGTYDGNRPGLPFLPARYTRLRLPAGARFLGVSIDGVTEERVATGIDVPPTPRFTSPSLPPPAAVAPDAEIYGTDGLYPEEIASADHAATMRGLCFVPLRLRPVRWNPVTRELFFVRAVTVTVAYEPSGRATATTVSPDSPNGSRITAGLRNQLINPGDFPAAARDTRTAGACDYLIITEGAALVTAFEALGAHRATSQGLTYEVKTVTDIAAAYSRTRPDGGADDQTAIRRCIQDYVANHDTAYVVLGGDNTVVPDRDTYVYVQDGIADGTIPTDLYYAGIDDGTHDDAWDQDADGTYGELDSAEGDLVPDVMLGRIPVRTAAHATAYIAKLQSYEAAAYAHGYTRRILFVGTLLWGSSSTRTDTCNDGLPTYVGRSASDAEIWSRRAYRDFLQAYGFDGDPAHFLADTVTSWDTALGTGANGSYSASASHLVDQINTNGYYFLHSSTHGNPTSWQMEHNTSFGTGTVPSLTQTVPVVTTMACQSSQFDDGTDPCFSEALVRSPNGALIYHGSSRYGLGYEISYEEEGHDTLYGGPSPELANDFYQQIAAKGTHCIGQAFLDNKTSSAAYATNNGYRWVHFAVNLIGDPSFTIPVELFVEQPDGSQTVYARYPTTIEWDVPTGAAANVTIELHKGGEYLRTVAASAPNSGSYAWDVPGDLDEGSDYTVVVTDLGTPTMSDEGPAFHIGPALASFPYEESFETDLGHWRDAAADGLDWTRHSGGTPSNSTGPDGAHNGSYYLYTEVRFWDVGQTAGLELHADFAGRINPVLSFRYHMYGLAMGSLHVDVRTGGAWQTDVWTVAGQQHSDSTSPWTQINVDLGAYAGLPVVLRIRGVAGSGIRSDMAIDLVRVDAIVPPDIQIEGDGNTINSGDVTPRVADLTDFGTVAGATTETRQFTIRNTGLGSLRIGGVAVTGATDFSVDTATMGTTVAPAGTTTFAVSFRPSEPGAQAATVRIASDDPDEDPYTFAISGTGTGAPEIDVQGNGSSIADGDATPDLADHTVFGETIVAGAPTTHTFTIANTGTLNLHLNGLPLVAISGTHATEFTVGAQPAATVAAGAATTVEITFSPTALGLRTATVSIASDDADESAYTFAIEGTAIGAPEIGLSGNGVHIADGDTAPDAGDHTDFGAADIATGCVLRTFTVANSGLDTLHLTGTPTVTIAGTHASEFTVTADADSTVPVSGSTSLRIAFDPAGIGLRSASVSIANDDSDENPYTFAILGNGTATPDIMVRGNGTEIANGDAIPTTTDHTDFGTTDILGGTILHTFTIANTGSAALTLDGTPLVAISGTHAADFTLAALPAASIAVAGTTTFQVSFDPNAIGTRTATLSIRSDDPDEDPYAFDIQGTGIFLAEDELPVRRGLLMQLDATSLTGYADGDPVSLWPDRSGNGNDGAPVGTDGAPAYQSAAIGGRPAVRFDGVDNNMVVGTVREENGGLDLFVVAAGPAATGGTWQRLVSAWSGIAGQNDWTKPSWQISRPNSGGAPSIFLPEVFPLGYNEEYKIGNLTFAASSEFPASSNLAGDIAEAVLFNQQLTAEERSKVGAYLQRKYGIAPTYTHPGTATVRAGAVSGLSGTAATLTGTLDSSGNSPAEVRIYYGIADGGSTTGSWDTMAVVAAAQSGMGLAQSISLAALTADTTYYARFAASNTAGLSLSSDVLIFTTTHPTVTVSDCVAYEGGASPAASFTITLSQAWGSDITVQYATIDDTAEADSDYATTAGTLLIPAEALSGTVTVPIRLDAESESPEQFQLQLTDAGDSAIADGIGVCTILDVYPAYHVAIDGDDTNPGTFAQPFATIEHARDTLAAVYANGVQPVGGITVWLRGGRYVVSDSIVFTDTHAGTTAAPITYQAYPGEEVRLTGGTRLQGTWFSLVTNADPVWSRLDAAAQGQVYQVDLGTHSITDFGTLRRRGYGKDSVLGALELFADREPQQLARWPNPDEFAAIDTVDSTTQFTYTGTRPERWTTAEEPWTHGYWYQMWADEHLPITGIETAAQTITMGGEHNYGLKAAQPYYVYNLLEEIDTPGEWYLNRSTGVLYYWPTLALESAELEVSMVETPLIQLTSTSNLRFADLTLECTRGELARIDDGNDNQFQRCIFRNNGTNAAVVSGAANGLDACTISQTGAGGAKLSGGDRNSLTDAGNFVTNSDIHHFGRWCWTYAPAVRSSGCGLVVEHNHIWYAPHTAILFGGNRNSVKYNQIHDVCRFSSDAGAIYTGRDWGGRGNEVSDNFIHHISSTFVGHGVHGIYLDDLVSGVRVHGNILYEISGHGIQHGGGRDAILTNNVLKNCGDGVAADSRGTGWAYDNINARAQDSWNLLHKLRQLDYQSTTWTTAYPACAAIPDDYDLAYDKANGWLTPGGSVLARNVYCNLTNGLQYTYDNAFSYYATIADNEEVCDPLFVDEAGLNMTIDPASPALLVTGFEAIPFSQIGPLREIDLQGNSIGIANGDTTPDSSDHTDFGEADLTAGTIVRTFTIANLGSAPLTLSGTPLVALSGDHAADFAVSAIPAAGVAANGTTTFQITFDPTALGLRSATVAIVSDDIDEGIYTFAIQGSGTWRSALYPSDWTPATTDGTGRFLPDFGYAGYHGGMEPIPDAPPGPVVDATQAPYQADPTGTTDSTDAIQHALDAVGEAGGGVVLLPAGTYLISLPAGQSWALRIRHPRTVLRGAGTDRTFLECTSTTIRNANILLVRPDAGSVFTELDETSHPLTVDADNRATTVTLDSTENLTVGDRAVLRSDWTQEFIDEHDMNGIWTPSTSRTGPLFIRRIVAIDGATVTLDTPLRYPLGTRDNARLYRCDTFLREVGIEDLSIGNRQHPDSGWETKTNGWGDEDYDDAGTAAYEVHGSHLVHFVHVWDGWLRRVNTYRPASNTGEVHALSNIAKISTSRFVTFANSTVQHTQYEGGGGNGYGLGFQDANDCLMTACEVIHTRHNYDFKCAGANGNVVHRSAGRTPRYASDFHMYLSIGNLFDSMLMDGDFLECRYRPYGDSANLHGHAGTQNVFWNTYGTDARTDKVVESRQYGDGYVIGTKGETTNVELTALDQGIDTSPPDWSEGVGTSQHLRPESLYESQLSRRAALLPVVSNTGGGTAITHDQATCNGALASEGSGSTHITLHLGTTDGGMMPEAWDQQIDLGSATPGAIAADLTYLQPATTYYYRLLAWNANGEDWANATASFTTGPGPAIRGDGAALLTASSASFHANLSGANAQTTLCWGTTDGGTDSGSWEHTVGPAPQTIGTFTVNATGLPAAATIYYRWHADAAGAIAWSPATQALDTTPVLTVADVEMEEDGGSVSFTLVLTPVSALDTAVAFATVNDTATAGQDYTAVSQTITIPAGDPSAPLTVPLLADHAVETYRKQFHLVLSNPTNATLGTATATGTIIDDDLPALPITDGLVLHLDASAQLASLTDDTGTTTWPDTSGNGNDATSDAGAPTFRMEAINTRPAFTFDGVDDTFLSPSIRPTSGPVSVYVLSEKDLPDGSNYQRLAACDNGAANDWTAPNWSINNPRGDGGVPLAYSARIDSRRYSSGYGISPVRLARQATSAGGWYKGKVGEFLVYNRDLTGEEHAIVTAWLNAKYSIDGTTVTPEIVVSGLGQTITNGDATPTTADNTDFGSTTATVTHTFQVTNVGTDELTLGTVSEDSDHFAVSAAPVTSSLPPGESTTFQITFAPYLAGVHSGTVTFLNNDSDEGPFTFAITGTGVGGPEIDVRGNSTSIADGDTTPTSADHTDLGGADPGDDRTRTFTIHNTGPFWLHLGTITIAGDAVLALDTSATATTVVGGAATTFSVTFSPTTSGLYQATLSIPSDDADEDPYTFAIQATCIAPEIEIAVNDLPAADGTPLDFGPLDLDAAASGKVVTVGNSGNRDLILSATALSGTHASAFSLPGFTPGTVVSAGTSTSFAIAFNPSVTGINHAALVLTNNDPDEGAFDLPLTGIGTDAPMAQAATAVTSTSFTANWQRVPNADSYRLDVSADPAFATFLPGYADRPMGTDTTCPVTALATGSHYHYRVRALFSTGTSASSNTVRVARAVTAPGAFTAPLAAQDLRGGDTFTVAWGSASDADDDPITYALEFFDGTAWSSLATGLAATTYNHTLSDDVDLNTVKYRVNASADGDTSVWTESDAFHLDGIDPTIAAVAAPAPALYRLGDLLTFTVALSEPVAVAGVPTLSITLDTGQVAATYDRGRSTTTALAFTYAIQTADSDTNGIGVHALTLAGGTIQDPVGNPLDLTPQNIDDASGITVSGPPLVFHVDATSGDDLNGGRSWPTAIRSLQVAINRAIQNDQVWVKTGTHTPGTARTDALQLRDGVGVYGGFAGDEATRAARNIAGNPTTLSGDIGTPDDPADNSYHVLLNPAELDSTAVLDGFVIRGGQADGEGENQASGGAILNLGASPTIRNCHFLGNYAASAGGALCNREGADARLENCTFSGNVAGDDGGAVYNHASTPSFLNCTFAANQTTAGAGHAGGAVYCSTSSPARFVNCTFSNNTANSGSALLEGSAVDATLTNCIFWDNNGTHGIAGDIADANITYSIIQGGDKGNGTCLASDPRLLPLADNGGPVPTMGFGHFSAAIDSALATGTPSLDARGVARPFGRAKDIGAFEADLPLLHASAPADNQTDIAIDSALTFTFQCEVTPVAAKHIAIKIVGGAVVETVETTASNLVVAGGTVTINPADDLLYGTDYCIQIEAGAFTGSGGSPAIDDEITLNFSTPVPPIYAVSFTTDHTPGATLDGDASQNITHGEDTTAIEAREPTGYHFTNWSLDGAIYSVGNPLVITNVTADMDIVARFAPNTYTWTFQPGNHGSLNGGEPDVTVPTTFAEDAPAPPTVTPIPGYTHAGWAQAIPATVGVGDQTFIAIYTPIEYTWTFQAGAHGDLVDGTPDVTIAVTFDEDSPTPPTVAPSAGYTHAGWSPLVAASIPVGDRTFTATYAPIEYAWRYRPGDHGRMAGPNDGDDQVTQVPYTSVPLHPPVVPDYGYRHAGWAPAPPATAGIGDRLFTALYERVADQRPTAGLGLGGVFSWDSTATANGTLAGIRSVQFAIYPIAWGGLPFDLGGGVSADIATGAVVVSVPATVYVNGQPATTLAEDRWNLVTVVFAEPVVVTDPSFGTGFLGQLDEICLWTTPLAAGTVGNWLYRVPDQSHPDWPSLAAWYRFAGSPTTCGNSANPGALALSLTAVTHAESNIRDWYGTPGEDTSLEGRLVGGWTGGCTTDGTDWTIAFETLVRPARGTLAIPDPYDNRFVYTPTDPGASFMDRFQYRTAKDGHYSTATTVEIIWRGPNAAPVLIPSAPDLGEIDDQGIPLVRTVGGLLGENAADADGDEIGLALLAATSPGGDWSYSLDGIAWHAMPVGLTAANALLLSRAAKLRFAPSAGDAGDAQLLFKAWDGTNGAPGTQLDVGLVGGTATVSAETDTATLHIGLDVPAPGEVWVGNGGTDPRVRASHTPGVDFFATLGEALAAVAENGMIHVLAGVYEEALRIDRPVTLAGTAAGDVVIVSEGVALTLVPGGNLSLSGFTVAGTTGLLLTGGALGTVRDCRFLYCDTGIRVEEGDIAAAAVSQCRIVGNGAGVINDTLNNLDCRGNWWGSASGPGGAGPGAGDSVSLHVLHDPWSTTDNYSATATQTAAGDQTLQALVEGLAEDCNTLRLTDTTAIADFDPPDGLDLQIIAAANCAAAAANVTLGTDDSVRVSDATFTCGRRTNAGIFEITGAVGTLHVNGDLDITGTERWRNTTVEIAAGVTVRVRSGGLLEIDECDISMATGAALEVQPGGVLSLLASSVAGGSILLQADASELRGCLLDAGCRLSVSGDQCQVMHNAFVGAVVSDTGSGNRWHDAAWGNAWLNGTPPASIADAAPAVWWQGMLYGTVGIRWLGAEGASPFPRAVAIALNGAANDKLALSFHPVFADQNALAFWQLPPPDLPGGALRVSLRPDNSLREARERTVSRSLVFEFVADDGTSPAPGDLDGDNRVDDDDLDVLRANWLTPGPAGDLNADGTIDLLDYQVLKPAYGNAGKGL